MGVFHIFKIVQMVPNRAKHRNLIGFANMVLQTCQKWSEAAKILLQQVLVLNWSISLWVSWNFFYDVSEYSS